MSGSQRGKTGADLDPERLEALLQAAGSAMNAAEVVAVLRGIAAAPDTGTAGDSDLWAALIAPSPTPELREELGRLKAAFALAKNDRKAAETDRTAELRRELARRGLDGFMVPRADEHQSEYVPKCAARLEWLTGFSGSAGVAILLSEKGAIFVDGRYILQVESQVPTELYQPLHLIEHPPSEWLKENLQTGAKLGYDPWLHTEADIKRIDEACAETGAELVACEDNPLDAIWSGRPPPPLAPVVPHDLRYAGQSSVEKREAIAKTLSSAGVAAVVLSAPDSIAWLLNIRGGDVEHTPLPLSFAIIREDARVSLFIDPRKLHPSISGHLGNGVTIERPAGLGAALDAAGEKGASVQVDTTSTPIWILQRLGTAGAKVVRKPDPCALPKARKNPVEMEGAREAHRRDAVAIARFLAWLAREAPSGRLTEMDAADRFLAFRRELPLFRDLSFSTISGAGPNGAIVHYRVTPETNRTLEPGSLYLVDSGAQFLDGTTDITRTIALGEATAEMRDRFTRVLKGHIALATARFPKGTTGSQIDVLARTSLWQAGLDFDHGTGHGIGSYLSVHEGPHRISKIANNVALEPGMIVSNEPGYYKAGAYGIRIENLVTVRPVDLPEGERQTFEFETLTLAPIDRALIDTSLLTSSELTWLNAYHNHVRETVGPRLDEQDRAWLDAATVPIA